MLLDEPGELHLPLASRRFHFRDVHVADGQEVRQGEPVATDPDHYGLPLLAPRAGTARLGEGEVVLTHVTEEQEEAYQEQEPGEHASKLPGPAARRRQTMLDLGAWQYFSDACTADPSAVIASTVQLEPFSARGDVQIEKRLGAFTRGLEHIQSLLEYQPIYLIVPDVQDELAHRVHERVRGYAHVKVHLIPLDYPFDDPALVARELRLTGEEGPVWSIQARGVLAVDRAMTQSRPVTVRIVAVGGPGVGRPTHVKALVGYPVEKILAACDVHENVRVIAGGALTGEQWPEGRVGLDAECSSLTVLPDDPPREFLGFARAGWDRQSVHRCYLSRLRKPFAEELTTRLRGERRACVACSACEEVCPAGIRPHLIHKYLYEDALEEAEAARIDLCVECGLCSYVCPSKIELLEQFREAKVAIARELAEAAAEEAAAEAEAAAKAEAEADEGREVSA